MKKTRSTGPAAADIWWGNVPQYSVVDIFFVFLNSNHYVVDNINMFGRSMSTSITAIAYG